MQKVKDFFTDSYKVGMVILDLLLLVSMLFNPDLQLTHFTYFAIASRIAFPFIVFFFGNKGIWIFFFIVANVNALDITFDDFTALSCICILFLFIPKDRKILKIIVACSYLIDVFLVASLHQKQPYHLFAHFIGCGMVILSVRKLYGKVKPVVKLDLTVDERIILEEMLKGKRQKEIEQFSQNTVTNKLREARERNGVQTTDELLKLYQMHFT